MSDYVQGEYNGIPYRAKPAASQPHADRVVWLIEYRQGNIYDWGPRGRFDEIQGKFTVGGELFDSAEDALRFRALNL